MALPTILLGISAGLSAYSAIQGGRAAKQAAAFDAAQLEKQKKQVALEAIQRENDRMEQFESATASNIAWFAFSGRDMSDRSVKAFLDKQKDVAYSDVKRSNYQATAETARLGDQQRQRLYEGRQAQKASYIKAATSIASGWYKYETVKV